MRSSGHPLAGRGGLLHWHPHIHTLVTCGAFTPDGEFLELPELGLERLQAAWRKAVFALYLAEFTQPFRRGRGRMTEPKVGRGWYSNTARGMRRKAAEAAVAAAAAVEPVAASSSGDAEPAPARSRASQTWAMLIKRLYELCEAQNYVESDSLFPVLCSVSCVGSRVNCT